MMGPDETVRGLREESHQRIEREARGRSFFAWCAVATLASGFALAALGARDAREAKRQAAQEAEDRERVARAQADACAALKNKLAAIEKEMGEQLALAPSHEERARIRDAAIEARAAATIGEPRRCPAALPAPMFVKPRPCVMPDENPLDGL